MGKEAALRVVGALGAAVIASCTAELADSPILHPQIDAVTWPDSLAVTDVDTLAVRVTLPDGRSVAGVQVDWQSSNPTSVELQPFPVQTGSRADSLAAQLKIIAIARARGGAQVTATIDRPGFASTTFRGTLFVTERWKTVSVGVSRTCALSVGGTAYCWGNAGLGSGAFDYYSEPEPVEGGHEFTTLSVGEGHACAEASDRLTYCWGFNGYGELGDQTQLNHRTPQAVSGGNFATVDVGGNTSCGVLLDDATTQCWGNQQFGQLGQGLDFPFCTTFSDFSISCRPGLEVRKFVRMKDGASIVRGPSCTTSDLFAFPDCPLAAYDISVGDSHACAVIRDVESVFCWGWNGRSQIGGIPVDSTCSSAYGSAGARCSPFGTMVSRDSDWSHVTPTPGAVLRAARVEAGGSHTCALTIDGDVYCWGANDQGQYGNGGYQVSRFAVPGATGLKLSSLSAGGNHTCGVEVSSAAAWCWGSNASGQLGNTSAGVKSAIPVPVSGGYRFAALSAGRNGTCGVTIPSGAIYCWGTNVGHSQYGQSPTPVRIAEPIR